MRKILLGSLISFALAVLTISVVKYFINVPKEANLKKINKVTINSSVSSAINIKDKVVVKKTVNNTNYLNSWKLTATVLGSKPVAMVLKGRDSRVLRLKDSLEGYEVKRIEKSKVLFVTNSNETWLYMKSAYKNIPQSVSKVVQLPNSFVVRRATFNRNLKRPEKLLRTINILPEMSGGSFKGLNVKYLLEGSFLYMHGLRQGDIIVKINGKKLRSIADGISAYQNVISSSKFSISVSRNNKIKDLKYEVVK